MSGGPAVRPTLQMVADAAGVSIATASYVLSGRVGREAGVRRETAVRVREAALTLGYQRRRAPERKRTDLVLLSVSDVTSLWSRTLTSVLSRALAPDGVDVIVLVGGDWQRVVRHRHVDVVVVDAPTESRAARTAIGRLVRRGDRIILWSRVLPPRGFDVIRPNDAGSVTVGLDYLRTRYDHVLYVDTDPSFQAERIRLETARARAAVDTGVEVLALAKEVQLAPVIEQALRGPRPPRAVFAHYDEQAHVVVDVTRRLGLDVPGDVAVLGIGDTDAGAPGGRGRRLTSMGQTDGYDYVAQLVRRRRTADSYEPEIHEVVWSVQCPGLTA